MPPPNGKGSDELLGVLQGLLRRPGGGRAVTDVLLELLAPTDVIYLRQRVQTVDLSRAFAQWSDLPCDVLCQIGDYLSKEDFLRARLVSRAWKLTWLQDVLLVGMLNTHYPGLLRAGNLNMSYEALFMIVHHLYARRRVRNGLRGLFIPCFTEQTKLASRAGDGLISVSRLSRNMQHDESEVAIPSHLYNDGKVAWCSPGLRFGVDDILAGRRVIYTLPIDRRKPVPQVELVALTEKMLVVAARMIPPTL